MRRLTPVRVSSLRSCSYGEGCFPTPLRRRGLLMIHLGCEKGLERPFSLFCHFRAAQAFELGKLPPDRWHRGKVFARHQRPIGVALYEPREKSVISLLLNLRPSRPFDEII